MNNASCSRASVTCSIQNKWMGLLECWNVLYTSWGFDITRKNVCQASTSWRKSNSLFVWTNLAKKKMILINESVVIKMKRLIVVVLKIWRKPCFWDAVLLKCMLSSGLDSMHFKNRWVLTVKCILVSACSTEVVCFMNKKRFFWAAVSD